LSEEWQFCYSVKGLVAPEKEITFGSVLIRGKSPSHEASVFFKTPVGNEKEKDDCRDKLVKVLRNIMLVYSLFTDIHVEVLSGSSSSKISSEHPFGDKKLCVHLGMIPVFDEERRNREIPILEKTIAKYESTKSVFEKKNKAFLKNAIDYYYRSLGDNRLEEKIIDLMIALESLFSKENDELGLRYSLRAGFLLGIKQEDKRPDVVRTVKKLYAKRSKIVHGTESVDLSYKEISNLQNIVKESIKRMIHIKMAKQNFLELIDEAVFDEEKKKLLTTLVEEAIEKW